MVLGLRSAVESLLLSLVTLAIFDDLRCGTGIGNFDGNNKNRNNLFVLADDKGDDNGEFKLTILHVNDIHSRAEEDEFKIKKEDLPVSITSEMGEDESELTVTYGGYPRLVTLFDEMESVAFSEENADGVLRLHAGDAISGSIFYTAYNWTVDQDMLQYICFDVLGIGNHEFDDGDTNLADFLTAVVNDSPMCSSADATAISSANIVPGPESKLKPMVDDGTISKYLIKEFEGTDEKVGIIGVNVRNKTMEASKPDPGTILLDERETVTKYAEELNDQGINKIVVLSHAGYPLDISYLSDIPYVDVIIGGDSHTLLGDEDSLAYIGTPEGPYPTIELSESSGTVCVYQAWEYGHGLGFANIVFDEDGKVVTCGGELKFPYDDQVVDPPLSDEAMEELNELFLASDVLVPTKPDKATQDALDVWSISLNEEVAVTLAQVPEGICQEREPGAGYSTICSPEETLAQGGGVCNLVPQGWMEQIPVIEIAFTNGGGCRQDIYEGDFTLGDAYNLLPFKDQLVQFDLTGAQLKQVFEEILDVGYPYASGVRFDVYMGNPSGDRLRNIEVNRMLQEEWTPLDLDETYKTLTIDFIADGGDGVKVLPTLKEKRSDLYFDYGEAFAKYAQSVGTLLDPPLELYSTQFYSKGETPPPGDTTTTEDDDTISDLLCADEDFTILCSLVDTCDIFVEGTFYTVFAPSDDSFEDLNEIVPLDSLPEAILCEILKFHVAEGEAIYSDDLVCESGDASLINMMDGKNTRVKCSKGIAYGIKGGGNDEPANFVDVDIEASNGVIHQIDDVLFFPRIIDPAFGLYPAGAVPSVRSDIP